VQMKNKYLAILVTAILTFSIAVPLASMPSASAHTPPWTYTTYAWAAAAPNPCGVNQQMLIYGWLDIAIPQALLTNNARFQNYKFIITQPDGTTVEKDFPYVSDPTSSQYFEFTPTQIGNYTVFFSFPGQTNTFGGTQQGDIYLPSNATISFTVVQNAAPTTPSAPLPTAYWTRPIYMTNTNWVAVGSNWLGGSAEWNYVQENGAAPTTPHIMWTKPLEIGGLAGGTVTQAGDAAQAPDDEAAYYSGFSYNTRFGNPIILQGVLYYQEPIGESGGGGPEVAVDIATGQTLWTSTTFYPSMAQIDDVQTPDQHGIVGGILWQVSGTTWIGYNAFTMQPLFNITGVPSGTRVYDNNGDILVYQFSYSTTTKTGWLALWNDTAAITAYAPLYSANAGFPSAAGIVINGSAPASYTYNVTITADLTGSSAPAIVGIVPGETILGDSSSIALASQPNPNPNPWTMWALSDAAGQQGTLIWKQNYAAPPGNQTEMLCTQPIDPVTNEWEMQTLETGQRYAYSLATGNLVWGPSAAPLTGFQYYSDREGLPAYGNLYVSGYGGIVYCYSMLNGTLLWTYGNGGEGNTTYMGNDGPWGLYPTHIAAFANGIVYTMSGEHSPNTPIYKGEQMRALNATTGQELWTLSDYSASGLGTSIAPVAIADGYITFVNAYDSQVYCVGQGPSKLTVTAPDSDVTVGSTITIRGTITDIAPGTQQTAVAANFPNGVPCVSDASQSQWMSYVYQQQPMPTNTTGVQINLFVLDANGNYRSIGTTTSDASGMFTFNWAPDVPGAYTVYAQFPGSNAYYPSSAETSFYSSSVHATPAPTATTASDLVTTSTLMTGLAIGVIAIIIAIAIVGALVLRKHP
jgi:hypothetical protein